MDSNSFFEKRDFLSYQRFEKITEERLPYFCNEFFNSIDSTTTYLTKLNYASDLAIFFDFLTKKHFKFKNLKPIDIEKNLLNEIRATDIEYFLRYLSFYIYNGKKRKNSEKAKARKLSTIRSMLNYFYLNDVVDENVANKVKTPKIREKNIIKLDDNEVSKLFMDMQEGIPLYSKFQKNYNKNTNFRDYVIISLFLHTGIRISECAGLNIDDFNLTKNSFRIIRKGGNEAIIYYPNSLSQLLSDFIKYRLSFYNENELSDDNKNALFLSLQKKRLSVRAIQNIVKKYTAHLSPYKNISPHKLRATYGTSLYNITKDIYVVAEVLGHKDINTTKTYYASMSEKNKKEAADKFKYPADT